jgi:hypothetical protein
VPRLSTRKGHYCPDMRDTAPMTAYARGYHDGWSSCLAEYSRLDEAFSTLLAEAEVLAEPASHGLTDPGDYWLGYHHGRATAKSRFTIHGPTEWCRAA